jgi:hypothetical protein
MKHDATKVYEEMVSQQEYVLDAQKACSKRVQTTMIASTLES